jgi:hypothetical protein
MLGMTEAYRNVPEAVMPWRSKWKPNRPRQTWEDLEAIAESRRQTEEAVVRWWEKQAAQEAGKVPRWVWVLAFLASSLSDATDDEVDEAV